VITAANYQAIDTMVRPSCYRFVAQASSFTLRCFKSLILLIE